MYLHGLTIAMLCAVAAASPVPYSTETNYGSSLSAAEEFGLMGRSQGAQIFPRDGLSSSEEAETKTFVNKLLDMWIGHPKNRGDAVKAVMNKVEEGAEATQVKWKRDMANTQGLQSWWKLLSRSFLRKDTRAANKEKADCEKMHDVSEHEAVEENGDHAQNVDASHHGML